MIARAERRSGDRAAHDSRHRAREAAVQMLYQWEVGRLPIADVIQTFWLDDEHLDSAMRDTDHQAFAETLAAGVADTVETLDPLIVDAAENWRIERMNVLDRLILRLAVYEFVHEPATPTRVIINEALELARMFSEADSVRFVNGVLDAVRRRMARA